eukprot:552957-Pleurochrysis_carterae.AAC.5
MKTSGRGGGMVEGESEILDAVGRVLLVSERVEKDQPQLVLLRDSLPKQVLHLRHTRRARGSKGGAAGLDGHVRDSMATSGTRWPRPGAGARVQFVRAS